MRFTIDSKTAADTIGRVAALSGERPVLLTSTGTGLSCAQVAACAAAHAAYADSDDARWASAHAAHAADHAERAAQMADLLAALEIAQCP